MVGEASPPVLDNISGFRLDELQYARQMEVAGASAARAAPADQGPSFVVGVLFEADPTERLAGVNAVGLRRASGAGHHCTSGRGGCRAIVMFLCELCVVWKLWHCCKGGGGEERCHRG
jgi:hypothetical protein